MYFLIFDWINKDSRTINSFIHWGNSLKMDFTERQFLNYRNTVMGWLSDYWHKKGDKELSAQYFAKLVDTINLDGELAHLKANASNDERYQFRHSQLSAILYLLNEYKSDMTIRWANIKSWISLLIALVSLFISLFKN